MAEHEDIRNALRCGDIVAMTGILSNRLQH